MEYIDEEKFSLLFLFYSTCGHDRFYYCFFQYYTTFAQAHIKCPSVLDSIFIFLQSCAKHYEWERRWQSVEWKSLNEMSFLAQVTDGALFTGTHLLIIIMISMYAMQQLPYPEAFCRRKRENQYGMKDTFTLHILGRKTLFLKLHKIHLHSNNLLIHEMR